MLSYVIALTLFPGPQGVEEAKAIVEASKARLAAATSISGTFTRPEVKGESTFRIAKPALFKMESTEADLTYDGTNVFIYMKSTEQYLKMPSSASDIRAVSMYLPGFAPFFGTKDLKESPKLSMGMFRGIPAAEVVHTMGKTATQSVFISKDTKLPVGTINRFGDTHSTIAYGNLKLDEPMDPASFAFVIPEGASEYSAPTGETDYKKDHIKPGAKAKDFAIKTPDGKPLSLASSLKGGKGVLVNFWFYG